MLVEARHEFFGFGFLGLSPIMSTHEQNRDETRLFNLLGRNVRFLKGELRLLHRDVILGSASSAGALVNKHLLG